MGAATPPHHVEGSPGSINFDPRSFALNAEFGVVIVDRDLAVAVEDAFSADCARSKKIEYAEFSQRGLFARSVESLCYAARAQL